MTLPANHKLDAMVDLVYETAKELADAEDSTVMLPHLQRAVKVLADRAKALDKWTIDATDQRVNDSRANPQD